MNVFSEEFERIYKVNDRNTGLRMVIAIHDRTLGPGFGGIRFLDYDSEEAMVTDVLRLAGGMTHKNAIIYRISQGALSNGGGKSVIWGDPKKDKTPELLLAAADAIEELNGAYMGGEDMNMTDGDLEIMFERTQHLGGLQEKTHKGGRRGSGNPGPLTALGVFVGIQACLRSVFGNALIFQRTFAIQGVGSVGRPLLERLAGRGAKQIIVSDTDEKKLRLIKKQYPEIKILKASDSDGIYEEECDVFIPCATGAIINDETIPRLRCRIIAGAANNQLLGPEHGRKLWGMEPRILYAPDYVINAGGAINVATEFSAGGYDRNKAEMTVSGISLLLTEIFDEATEKDVPPEQVAGEIVGRILSKAREEKERKGS